MNASNTHQKYSFWLVGAKDTSPFLIGVISVGASFGVAAVQAGFNFWQAILISALLNAGASQFIFIALVAANAPIWLIVSLTLLTNTRHLAYGPNLAPHISTSRCYYPLMHGLTDQVYLLAYNKLPQLPNEQRLSWYSSVTLASWVSWVVGTALGAWADRDLLIQWPLVAEVSTFTLPLLFLTLLAPKFNNLVWVVTLSGTSILALIFAILGFTATSIPIAALLGLFLHRVALHLIRVPK